MSMILSVAMLLEWSLKRYQLPELNQASKSIEMVVDRVLLNATERTLDLGGQSNIDSFSKAVATEL